MTRIVDHHGVMHYAWGSMMPGGALCGRPPIGCFWTDSPRTIVYDTVSPDPVHDSVCEVCSAMLGRTP